MERAEGAGASPASIVRRVVYVETARLFFFVCFQRIGPGNRLTGLPTSPIKSSRSRRRLSRRAPVGRFGSIEPFVLFGPLSRRFARCSAGLPQLARRVLWSAAAPPPPSLCVVTALSALCCQPAKSCRLMCACLWRLPSVGVSGCYLSFSLSRSTAVPGHHVRQHLLPSRSRRKPAARTQT